MAVFLWDVVSQGFIEQSCLVPGHRAGSVDTLQKQVYVGRFTDQSSCLAESLIRQKLRLEFGVPCGRSRARGPHVTPRNPLAWRRTALRASWKPEPLGQLEMKRIIVGLEMSKRWCADVHLAA